MQTFLPKQIISALFFLCFSTIVWSQQTQKSESESWFKKLNIQPSLAVQVWGTYTTNQYLFDEAKGNYVKVDDRFNMMIRRTRFGFKAAPSENFQFVAIGAFDFIGRDVMTGPVGGTNNGNLPSFGLWHAFFQWRIKKDNEAFNLIGGYFVPQIGRESMTGAFNVPSFEKSWDQNYLRTHLTGHGSGRVAGLNFGGLWLNSNKKFGIQYHLGIHNPNYVNFGGNSSGVRSSSMIVARTVLYIGDPEQEQYKISYKLNYFGKRKGLSIGFSGAYQGATDIFTQNTAAEVDILFNWGPLNVDGSWIFMQRKGELDLGNTIEYSTNAGHIRATYNIPVVNGRYVLEPAFMLMQYNGGTSSEALFKADLLKTRAGLDYTYDAGFNLHLVKDRLSLFFHYTWYYGSDGAAEPGNTVNIFYTQNSVGAIQRGNWLGLGINAAF